MRSSRPLRTARPVLVVVAPTSTLRQAPLQLPVANSDLRFTLAAIPHPRMKILTVSEVNCLFRGGPLRRRPEASERRASHGPAGGTGGPRFVRFSRRRRRQRYLTPPLRTHSSSPLRGKEWSRGAGRGSHPFALSEGLVCEPEVEGAEIGRSRADCRAAGAAPCGRRRAGEKRRSSTSSAD